jgi:H/ACA ribonucleoprotein complex subunit 2
MDILSHIPILCEETDNPYVFVTSKDALGAASSTKRPTSCVMICPTGTGAKKAAAKGAEEKGKEDYAEDYAAPCPSHLSPAPFLHHFCPVH